MVDVLEHDQHSALPLLTQQGISPAAPARSTADRASSTQCTPTPVASSCRSFLLRLPMGLKHRTGVAAVPPFLHLTTEMNRKQGEHGCCRPRAGLQKLNGVRGTTARCKVGNKTPTHPAPAGFLASPCETAARPREFLAIKKAATGPDNAEAVLAARTGVNAAGLQQCLDFRTAHDAGGGSVSFKDRKTIKNHPRRGGQDTCCNQPKLNRALPRRGY